VTLRGKYDLVLIDADDTLFDFGACEGAALRAALGEAGLTWSEGAFAAYVQANREAWAEFEKGAISQDELRTKRFRVFLQRTGLACDPELLARLYVARLSEQAALLPGAERVVRELSARYKLALVTNGIAEVQRGRLSRSPISPCFSAVVISGEIGLAKPDPRMLEAAARAAGAGDKARMVMVGDSLSSDIRAGRAFGIDTIWLNPRGESAGDAKPTLEIRSIEELLEIL
jgi:2-haloacid dehalogenase